MMTEGCFPEGSEASVLSALDAATALAFEAELALGPEALEEE